MATFIFLKGNGIYLAYILILVATFSLLLTTGLAAPQAEATNSSSNSTRPPYDDCMPFDPDKAMECARNFRVNDIILPKR